MDKSTRVSPEAPISCLEDRPTPPSAEEIPAPNGDPPARSDPPPSRDLAPRDELAPNGERPPSRDLAPSHDSPPGAEEATPDQAPPAPRSLAGFGPVARLLEELRPMAEAVVTHAGVPAQDAPDVVQNLLIGLLPRWGERAAWPPARRAVYVAAAARVAARRYLGRTARRSEVLTPDSVLQRLQERAAHEESEAPTAEDRLLSVDVWAERPDTPLDFLQASTTPAFWRVLYAYSVLGIPIALIAQSEEAPVGTIYNRLRLARRDLRAAIARRRASLLRASPS